MPKRRLVAVLGLLAGCSAGEPDFVDLATLERPASPNTYLVCPRSLTPAPIDREPPVFALEVDDLERHWLRALAEEPRTRQRRAEPLARRYLYVQRTPVLRFPDVIQVQFVAVAPDASTVCLYSRSIYGYSDLGQNRRRIERWLARIGP
ncbi:MAG: DUF1499 domain-containing protein [Pseudomonadota bacterium]